MAMKVSPVNPEVIRDIENHLDETKRVFLRRYGWQETSQTPGNFWMWMRFFENYGHITAPTGLAGKMTEAAEVTGEILPLY